MHRSLVCAREQPLASPCTLLASPWHQLSGIWLLVTSTDGLLRSDLTRSGASCAATDHRRPWTGEKLRLLLSASQLLGVVTDASKPCNRQDVPPQEPRLPLKSSVPVLVYVRTACLRRGSVTLLASLDKPDCHI